MLRRSLVLPHIRCCPIHHVYLQSSCPCGRSLWRHLFSAQTQPFTCHKCGLAWAKFARQEADPKRVALEQKILTWYSFFFSKGSRMLLARALQLIGRTMEERKITTVKHLNGRSLRVTFSSPEKTTLARLVDVLVSLKLSPEDLEADEGPLLWRPINWQTFYCPVPTCPYMG